MGHPFANIRQHDVERSRVGSICKGYATGGAVHDDVAADTKLVKKMVKPAALKMDGGVAKARMDRPGRAKGGRVKKAGTNVNVIIAPQGAQNSPSAGGVGPVPPPKPPGPPMPPPMAGPPGGGPGLPMAPPGVGPMPPRANGGRAYATGGGVKDYANTKKYMRPSPNKMDGKDIGRPPVVPRKTGGAINASPTGPHGPKFIGGNNGLERLQEARRAARNYKKA